MWINQRLGKDNTSYAFIYGGNDSSWVQNFKIAIGKIEKHVINNVDINIEPYQLGESNPDNVPSFWIGLDGKKKNKGCKDKVDCEIQEVVRTLLCLKQDPSGWVVLGRGRNLKILGHAEPMYQTVLDFDKWKSKVLEKETFDVAFKEYYDVVKEKYASLPYDHTSSVLATITCPNPLCGRVMEVTSINYRCCHGSANSCNLWGPTCIFQSLLCLNMKCHFSFCLFTSLYMLLSRSMHCVLCSHHVRPWIGWN